MFHRDHAIPSQTHVWFSFLVSGMVIYLCGCGVLSIPGADGPSPSQRKQLESQIATPQAVSYKSIFLNTILPKCVGCHNEIRSDKGIRYDTYAFTMASGTVVPGNTAQSTFCQLLIAKTLPPEAPPVTNKEVLDLCDWIKNGAKEN